MRTAALVLALAASVTAAAAQEKEKPTPREPKKGDTIYVKGCLDSSVVVSTEMKLEDETGEVATALTFRLTGEKDLLKKLRKEHDGRIVEITGILKSNLPIGSASSGVQIGKTRVHIGIASPQPGSPMQQTTQSLPVLEVKSYEGSATTCKG